MPTRDDRRRELPTVDLVSTSRETSKHGVEQVHRMLADRPFMRWVDGHEIEFGDPIFAWAAKQYERQRVIWDPIPPPEGVESNFTLPVFHDGLSSVRIQDAKASADALWSVFAFEMFNIANKEAFRDAIRSVSHCRMSRSVWIERTTRLEHQAMLKAVEFFRSEWLPWANELGLATDVESWRVTTPSDYDAWLRNHVRHDYIRFLDSAYTSLRLRRQCSIRDFDPELRFRYSSIANGLAR